MYSAPNSMQQHAKLEMTMSSMYNISNPLSDDGGAGVLDGESDRD